MPTALAQARAILADPVFPHLHPQLRRLAILIVARAEGRILPQRRAPQATHG